MTDSKLAKQAALPRRPIYRSELERDQHTKTRVQAIALSKRKTKAKRK